MLITSFTFLVIGEGYNEPPLMYFCAGGDTDILKLDLTIPSSPSWKDVGQLTEKAGTKLEISTIDCDLVHSYIDEDPCPSGWSRFEGNCYKYYDNSVSWEDARNQCLTEEVLGHVNFFF